MTIRTIAVLVCACLLAATAATAAEEAPPKNYGQNVGTFLKSVTIKHMDADKAVDTGKLANSSIFFMVNSVCSACKQELFEVASNMKYFKGKADVYAVVIDMDPASAVVRIKKDIPEGEIVYLSDPDYKLGNLVNLVTAPSTLIVDKDGKIIYKNVGYGSGQWKEYVNTISGK